MRFIFIICILTYFITGCSSTPPAYERMPTTAQRFDQIDLGFREGTAITPKGAVVDIKIEEVQAQKKKLEFEVWGKTEKIKFLEEKISDLEGELMQLRLRSGLPAYKPKPHADIGPNGYIVKETFKPSPSLDEEFSKKETVSKETISE